MRRIRRLMMTSLRRLWGLTRRIVVELEA